MPPWTKSGSRHGFASNTPACSERRRTGGRAGAIVDVAVEPPVPLEAIGVELEPELRPVVMDCLEHGRKTGSSTAWGGSVASKGGTVADGVGADGVLPAGWVLAGWRVRVGIGPRRW